MHFGPFYVYSIVPHPTTPPIWKIFQALFVYFDHMHILKVSWCSNMVQPISEWHFWAWKYDILAKMQCLCSGGKNKVSVRDHGPWLFPMGMGWMTGWYFGAPYWFYNLRRSYLSYHSKLCNTSITKLHWRICEIKIMIPIRITLVKWWWTTRDNRRERQCFSTQVDVCASDPSGVVLWNPLRWDILLFIILWFISVWKPCSFCACHRSKMDFIQQPHGQ